MADAGIDVGRATDAVETVAPEGASHPLLRHHSTPRESPPAVPDFGSIDFTALWRGRERTIEVERILLAEALGPDRHRRILEIGTGDGRLSATVQSRSEEYVGVDLIPRFLTLLPGARAKQVQRVAGNVYHLPFGEGSFDCAVMIRTYNFLPRPEDALREVRRVLAPGGLLVLSYNPKPSVATFVDDLKTALASEAGHPRGGMSFSAAPCVPVHPSSLPAWVPTRRAFLGDLSRAGFTPIQDFPCGLEDYRGLRILPARVFLALAHIGRKLGLFPSRFVVASREGGPAPELPASRDIWRCPRCRKPVDVLDGQPLPCPTCGVPVTLEGGIVDAR